MTMKGVQENNIRLTCFSVTYTISRIYFSFWEPKYIGCNGVINVTFFRKFIAAGVKQRYSDRCTCKLKIRTCVCSFVGLLFKGGDWHYAVLYNVVCHRVRVANVPHRSLHSIVSHTPNSDRDYFVSKLSLDYMKRCLHMTFHIHCIYDCTSGCRC